jgi:hypothetical protein
MRAGAKVTLAAHKVNNVYQYCGLEGSARILRANRATRGVGMESRDLWL